MTPSFGLTSHKLAHFFCLFSFLGECHPDRGIEWSGLLPHKHAVLLLPSTTHLPCILQWFWITLSPVCICFSQSSKTMHVLWWHYMPMFFFLVCSGSYLHLFIIVWYITSHDMGLNSCHKNVIIIIIVIVVVVIIIRIIILINFFAGCNLPGQVSLEWKETSNSI